jgi:hypothetical protein
VSELASERQWVSGSGLVWSSVSASRVVLQLAFVWRSGLGWTWELGSVSVCAESVLESAGSASASKRELPWELKPAGSVSASEMEMELTWASEPAESASGLEMELPGESVSPGVASV